MENNENLNNQVNENNAQPEVKSNVQPTMDNRSVNNTPMSKEEKPKNNNILVILLILIIVGVGGYFAYTKFIAKENDNSIPTPTPSNNQEQDNDNKNEENNNSNDNNQQGTNNNGSVNVEGLTYKTNDGKKTLKILKKNGEGYSAEYNGTKLDIYGYENYDKYGAFVGDKAGTNSQCGEYYFVVNNQTQELLNFEYGDSSEYIVEKVGNKHYFIRKKCYSINSGEDAVYNEDLNKIANEFITLDKNNNFYAMKDGYITKFDSNGKEIKHSSIKPDNKYDLSLDNASIIDNNFYALVEVSSKLYLYDFSKDTKIELNNPYKSIICPDGNCAEGIASMQIIGKKLLIILHPSFGYERAYQNDVTYLYNPSNSKLDSIGNFLTFDEDKEYGEGNFYLYDNTSLYKYDNSGNLVIQTAFDYNKVVYTAATNGFVAYKGNFFVTIKENSEYYLQDAFNKDKYKIDMVDGYEFYSISLLDEHRIDRYVATNIIEISLITGSDREHNVSFIKYKFNIDTKTMSK